jgi:hypothetical protein
MLLQLADDEARLVSGSEHFKDLLAELAMSSQLLDLVSHVFLSDVHWNFVFANQSFRCASRAWLLAVALLAVLAGRPAQRSCGESTLALPFRHSVQAVLVTKEEPLRQRIFPETKPPLLGLLQDRMLTIGSNLASIVELVSIVRNATQLQEETG